MDDRQKPADDLDPSRSQSEDRYAIDERTGIEYVKSRPGARKVTSEEIRDLLKDFP